MPGEVTGGGLAAADRYYRDYGARARELKKQGQRIIGYLCAFTTVEIITAAGLVPFRIKGDVNERLEGPQLEERLKGLKIDI
jgi:benzoyl-CoA reductase/2-hydroxyglutaryl-CoA dehydratase subunit BcrC/BadD/HgdB